MKVLITGINRGIGYGLCEYYLEKGYEVYGLGRSNPFDEVKFYKIDLRAFEKIPKAIKSLNIDSLDLAILNAGILGDIKLLKEWSVKELEEIFDINVWSNKVLIDEIASFTKKIVLISSGAAVNGNAGWGGYALSKCALNMLVSIYSKEIDTKIYALAPGVIDTDMVRKVISANKNMFSSVARVEANRINLKEGVKRVAKAIEVLDKFGSGSFVDVRNLNETY